MIHAFEVRGGPLGGVPDDHARRALNRGQIDHFSLEAADIPSFVAVCQRLVELGASNGDVTDFGPFVSVFFTDPDGFILELSLAKTTDWDPPFDVAEFDPTRAR